MEKLISEAGAKSLSCSRLGRTTSLHETAENERVPRGNTRGVNNPQIIVYDKDWNEIRNGSTKYEPARTWMPDHFEVGAKFSTEATYSMQRPVSWSDPQPVTTASEVTAAETVTTTAGHFETSVWRSSADTRRNRRTATAR